MGRHTRGSPGRTHGGDLKAPRGSSVGDARDRRHDVVGRRPDLTRIGYRGNAAMTVRLTAQGEIVLEGTCSSEDAEVLLQSLTSTPTARVDLRACEFAHTAVIQVLLAAKPEL